MGFWAERWGCYLWPVNEHPTDLLVTCAIVEEGGKVLVAQRSASMVQPLKWEFPGGKVEPGESEKDCLVRECREELDLEVEVLERLEPSTHRYAPDQNLVLIPFRCKRVAGILKLREHADARWLAPEDLRELDWAAADIPILESYLHGYGRML